MKKIISPITLAILVSTSAFADDTHTDSRLTQAMVLVSLADSDATVGQQHISQGTAGTDDQYNGGNAAALTVTNNSSISMTPLSTDNLVIGLQAASLGGTGYTSPGNDDGGDGGDGNTVTVTVAAGANITISGASSVILQNGVIGLLASSRGGDGGSLNPGVIDHYGGTAGSAANVTLDSEGTVTLGSESAPLNGGSHTAWGVVAQSIGGRGGPHAKGAGASSDDPTGNGGSGGTVIANVTGDVSVYWNPASQGSDACTGNDALGIKNCSSVAAVVAASVGGTGGQVTWTDDQGGNGGHAAQATANVGTLSNTGTITQIIASTTQATLDDSAAIMVISAGGHGGGYGTNDATGGDGGNSAGATATVSYTNVQTFGDSLSGVRVLSQGGDAGGNAPGTLSDDSTGGNGGTAGPAIANLLSSSVTTSGSMAYGVLVQAIGGLGGLGTDQGGQGAGGGDATANLDSGSSVSTSGDYAAAVVAQSLAGAGGSGGAWTSWIDGSSGDGGIGGGGATATVTTDATLGTTGDYAHGVLVQSIGGSGGTGATAGGVVALGGSGGRGGNGGAVTGTLGGVITTAGTGSIGGLVQSIGGGGGNAGSASGVISVGGQGGAASEASAVKVTLTGGITTLGESGIGILAQSIGGGGGNAGSAQGVSAVGGQGSAGGNGDTVHLIMQDSNSITTSGLYSHGAVAQSVGGGGGNGGSVFSLSLGSAEAPPALGGSGSGGGTGSVVEIKGNGATIATQGAGATGLLAQSIGGGGGTGGSAMQAGLDFVSLAIGGAGGQGGNSGIVTVGMENSIISTQGSAAPGITAQSIGGGGGYGGASHGSSVNAFFGTDVTIGGSAGNGGDSGTVAVGLKKSSVTTAGGQSNQAISDSYGVLAQAIGGGGGNGGSAQASDLDLGVPTGDGSIAISTTLAIGGYGGNGGHGAILFVGLEDSVSVATGGIGSHGVLAQSIGGGGGAGGASHAMSTTSTTSPDDTLQIAVSVAVGGSAGSGGFGGHVDVVMDGTSSITTYDDFSNAMMAQSIGGGGGNAGIGSSKTGGSGQLIKATIGVGGTGGSGGYGGVMNAQLDAGSILKTMGSGSRGMLLQSIGGGGGTSQGGTVQLSASGSGGDDDDDSYSATVKVSLGATGTTAGDGGAVTVTAQGAISTAGGDADGILAQSIGGGGGLAGSAGSDAGAASGNSSSAYALLGDDDDSNSYALQLSVGGNGGIGGAGGAVSLANFTGTVTTQGTYADGIVLQSIGGGGGAGGTATASGVTGSTNVTMAVGGQGGAAGNGGTVTIDLQGDGTVNKGAISTNGDVAYGLLAQSIGGGGGQGADGSANTAQSSDSTSSVTLGASGSSPNGGSGNQINTGEAASVLSVSTAGFNSHAIVLQSIGGGGGTASVATVGVAGEASTPNFNLTLGGGGGQDNGGGSSPVTKSSGGHIGIEAWLNVQTTGEHAFGLVAQSIGGGGGIVASGVSSNVNTISIAGDDTTQDLSGDTINISIGNYGSQQNSENPSLIVTTGKGAHGIVLQSIGGGGGIAGYTANGALSAGWNGTAATPRGSSSSGGDITLDYSGKLTTAGDGAYGIIAQSIADGGGLAGNNAGSYAGSAYNHNGGGYPGSYAGNVTINQGGMLSVTGSDAYAIFAQSDGELGNDKAINVNIGGNVTATASTGGGVWIDGTAQTNKVTILSGGQLSAASAIRQTGTGSAAVTNYGQVAGSMSLSDQGAALGTFSNFGTLMRADNIKGHVLNHGNFLIGQTRGTDRTHVTGDFTQSAQGKLHVGADFVTQGADVLQVDGSARLDGVVKVHSSRLMPGRAVTFLQAGAVTSNVTAQGASSLFDFSTQYSGNRGMVTVGRSNFDSLSQSYSAGRNPRGVGSHLQNIWDRGGSEELAGVYAALDQAAAQGRGGYIGALSSLSAGISAAPAALKTANMASFANSLLSCPHYRGAELLLSESSCAWGQITARTARVEGSHGTSSFDSDSVTYQVGMQRQIAPKWFAGVSVAYENGHVKANDRRQSMRGDTGYLGASLKYEDGPWMMAGTVTGSYGSFDSTRNIELPGISEKAKSSPDVMSLGQRFRLAYTHSMDKTYIKPMVDLDMIYTRMPSYAERGAGALNLHYDKSDRWAAILTPGVEVGGRIDLGKGYVARPFVNVGLSLSSTDHWDSRARLQAAPSGSRKAKSTLESGNTYGRIGAGVQLYGSSDIDLRLQYEGLFSDKVRSHSGALKASWRY